MYYKSKHNIIILYPKNTISSPNALIANIINLQLSYSDVYLHHQNNFMVKCRISDCHLLDNIILWGAHHKVIQETPSHLIIVKICNTSYKGRNVKKTVGRFVLGRKSQQLVWKLKPMAKIKLKTPPVHTWPHLVTPMYTFVYIIAFNTY